MSPNPYPLFSVSQSDKPEQIKLKTKLLIQLYVKDSSPFIASAVVDNIAALLAYPKCISDIEERCQLQKMKMHWRCLSWLDSRSDLIKI